MLQMLATKEILSPKVAVCAHCGRKVLYPCSSRDPVEISGVAWLVDTDLEKAFWKVGLAKPGSNHL